MTEPAKATGGARMVKPHIRDLPGIGFRWLREAIGWRVIAYKDGWLYSRHGLTGRQKTEPIGTTKGPPDDSLFKRGGS
jgi:hypothetical protein